MGIYTARPSIVTSNQGLPLSTYQTPMAGLGALGYPYFGANPRMSGMSPFERISLWNRESSKGRKKGVAPWGVKGMYSDPGDINFAKMIYRFQHDYSNCPSPSFGQNVSSTPDWDVTKKGYADCGNRDGMIGHGTMCAIVKVMTLPDASPFWRNWFAANMDLKTNLKNFAKDSKCGVRCADASCQSKAILNCPPCGSGQTGGKSVVDPGADQGSIIPDPFVPTPGPKPGPKPPNGLIDDPVIIDPLPEVKEGNMGLVVGAMVLIGVAGYFLNKDKK
tara:strand:+ start:126 stop:953 length:828 start_codon:yes stop_codon:yes gene_type:complete